MVSLGVGQFSRSPVLKVSYFRALMASGVGAVIIFLLMFSGKLKDNIDLVYEASAPAKIVESSVIRFEESSRKLGIVSTNRMYFPNPQVRNSDRNLALSALHPSVSVVDINDDGFMDIYISSASPEPNELYVNVNGQKFVESAQEYGIGDINGEYPSGPTVFADFNNDGFLDLAVAKTGCHQFFLGQGPKLAFVDHSEWLKGYCSNPHALNVADFNRDGKLDLVFGNYYEDVNLRKIKPRQFVWGSRHDKSGGGENRILMNSGKSFDSARFRFPSRTFTNSVGIIDIDLDGWPDLIFGNDYATDEMWRNRRGEGFRDVTEKYIPSRLHGLAGMNSEVMDFDQDGLLDIYVSNIYKPPFNNFHNLLWKNTGHGFKEVANDVGVAKCGFSWGAKFADFDLDGNLDLMVVNGRGKSPQLTKPSDGRSYWFERSVISQTPMFMRHFFAEHRSQPDDQIYISSFERSCLFEQKDGHFYDVALNAGITDLEDGKGLALVDYDNDGKMDFIVVNDGGPALLYHNVSKTTGHWIGFSLRNKFGSSIPVGAIGKLFVEGKQAPLVRALYPNNGYSAQSDPRFLFGLGDKLKPIRLEVAWADGQKEVFDQLAMDTYQKIEQGHGQIQ